MATNNISEKKVNLSNMINNIRETETDENMETDTLISPERNEYHMSFKEGEAGESEPLWNPLEVEAARREWGLNVFVLTPSIASIDVTHLVNVVLEIGLCGGA